MFTIVTPSICQMPKTDTPSAEPIAFHVPAPLLKDAQEMAKLEGWKDAEFHRLCWEAGLALQAEKSNKRLVNKGLRAKHTGVELAGEASNKKDYVTMQRFKSTSFSGATLVDSSELEQPSHDTVQP
jgi:hypothetical protein